MRTLRVDILTSHVYATRTGKICFVITRASVSKFGGDLKSRKCEGEQETPLVVGTDEKLEKPLE